MRRTPAQLAMEALLGHFLPMGMPHGQSLAERIQRGRASLVRISGVDLGFDPEAWHEHLRETDAGAYRWSNKHLGFPKRIREALESSEWREAIAELNEEREVTE